MIELTFPLEPRPQQRVRLGKCGNVYNPSGQDKDKLSFLARVFYKSEPIQGPLQLEIEFYLPLGKHKENGWHFKKPDISNLIKLIEDALNGICYTDDCQIVKLLATKQYSKNTRTVVRLTKVEET